MSTLCIGVYYVYRVANGRSIISIASTYSIVSTRVAPEV